MSSNGLIAYSRDVRDIFEPLVVDVEGMVEEQVGLVRLKRLSERHEQGKLIKVSECQSVHQISSLMPIV